MKPVAIIMLAPCGLLLASPHRARSQEGKSAAPDMKQPASEEMKKMMEGMRKWMASIQPGKHHQALDQFVGQWDTVTRLGTGGSGSPPTETKGVSDIRWVLGKRFLLEEHKGEWLMPDASGGMKPIPYEGIGMWGYDNIRNMYTGTWASSAGTNLQTMTGSADPSGKLFRFYGEMDEPMLDVYGRTVKFEIKVVSEDKHVFAIYDLHAGDDYRVVEITYTKRK